MKILLIACSPQDVNPVLDFEKEEDTILEVTKDLPIEIDIEDTGSLEGLGERLATNKYDVVHIKGHADIDRGYYGVFQTEHIFIKIQIYITPTHNYTSHAYL